MFKNSFLKLKTNAMIEIQNWGLIEYGEALLRQKQLVDEIQQNRNKNVLVLCQHPSVITIGRNGGANNIICHRGLLEKLGIAVHETNRGGDVTLHNPGQIVGYPIFNLSALKEDLHWFLRKVEECIIQAIGMFGLNGERVNGLTGVWLDGKRKICAIGLHCSRWVTSHGFALNVENDITQFDYIIPCGIIDKAVTSMKLELQKDVNMILVENTISEIFSKKFNI